MPHHNKQVPQDNEPEDLTETARFLQNLRLKVFVGFTAALMMLYSFFGNIYRIPMQLEQLDKSIIEIKLTDEKRTARLNDIEKVLAAKEDLFAEIIRTRSRVEAIERLESSRTAMQAQLDRLESVTKDLTILLASTTTRLTELNANMTALKETTVETKRALEDIKRKSP
ncbi:hypothetical protein EKK58_00720 [Candidatus Dependentiae bacterium]|nr:MAG: hypothetical protein EKK58_00720 [Candidatus Dependentiae bacterium]